MLKFTYTETSFHLDRLAQSVEQVVTDRVIVALRIGKTLCVEPITASFLLPLDLPGVQYLEAEANRETADTISLCVADSEYLEISLRGTWIAAGSETAEGIFVTSLYDRTEFFLLKLWKEAQKSASFVREVGD